MPTPIPRRRYAALFLFLFFYFPVNALCESFRVAAPYLVPRPLYYGGAMAVWWGSMTFGGPSRQPVPGNANTHFISFDVFCPTPVRFFFFPARAAAAIQVIPLNIGDPTKFGNFKPPAAGLEQLGLRIDDCTANGYVRGWRTAVCHALWSRRGFFIYYPRLPSNAILPCQVHPFGRPAGSPRGNRLRLYVGGGAGDR